MCYLSVLSVAKQLDGSGCHLVRSKASTKATLCWTETQISPRKGHSSPTFAVYGRLHPYKRRPMSIVAKRLGGSGCHLVDIGLGPGDIVLDGDQLPPTQKGAQQPHLSAHVYCGQTAEWIRIQLGTDVSLGPGDIVSDGDQATPRKGAQLTPPFGLLCCGTVAHFSNC